MNAQYPRRCRAALALALRTLAAVALRLFGQARAPVAPALALRTLAVVALVCGASSACNALLGRELNPAYCAAHPEDPDCPPLGPGSCGSTADCSAPLVCDTQDSRTCVECTAQEAGACTGATPVCGDDERCRGCTAHTECPGSNTCLPDGRCADPGEVAYVRAGGTGLPPCTQGAPCGTLRAGIAAIDALRSFIKISGTETVADNQAAIIDGRAVTILADPGTRLDRTGDGGVLVVRSNDAKVAIYDLEITGQSGTSDEVIRLEPNGGAPALSLVRVKITNNQGRGIVAGGGTLSITEGRLIGNSGIAIVAMAGAVAVARSTIAGNVGGGVLSAGATLQISQSTIASNTNGGISVMNGTFSIVGNVFFLNGTAGSVVGALSISTQPDALHRLELNSFHQNAATPGVAPAVQCTVAGPFTARNNVMSENGTPANMNQTGGTCAHVYSIVRPGTVPAGQGNASADPMFVNGATGDLHVKPGSPVRGAADPSSDLTGPAAFDIDGDARASPADIGADEVP